MCCFATTSMQTTFKCIQRAPQGQSSLSSQCLLRQNNRLLKCQPASLRRESGCAGRAAEGDGGIFFPLFFSFNVTWAWHIFTRVKHMPENINRGNVLSHPYISTHRLSKRHERVPSTLHQRQISISCFCLDGVVQTW